MSRLLIGPAVVAVIAAGLVIAVDSAGAQPPEFQRGKGFQKGKGFPKGFPKEKEARKEKDREGEKRMGEDERADALKRLEAELDRVKAHEAELMAKMRELRGPMRGGERPGAGERGGRGGPDRMGGFGPRGGPMGGFGGRGPGGFGGFGPGSGLPIDRMSPDQIRTLISRLQQALEEKTRGERGGERPDRERKETRERPAPQDDVLRRLDQLSKEIEEIRRSIRK